MEGDEGTDEHFGGRNNDFIDASSKEDFATDAPDLVDCGPGIDQAVVLANDIVRDNCEQVTPLTTITAETGTTDEEQQQQKEDFLARRDG